MNHRYKTLGHEPILTTEIFSLAYKQVAGENGDKWNLPATIARQALHFGSDYFTKLSLPIPFVGMLSDNAAKWLTKNRIDMWSVTRSATVAGLVNMLIAWLHRLFYDPEKYTSPKVY